MNGGQREKQGKREKIWGRRGLFISLFYSTTKPPFFHVRLAHPLGKTQRVASNCIEQRQRDSKSGKKRKKTNNNNTGENKKQRTKNKSCCFCENSKCPCFRVFLVSLYSELLCSGCSNHIGGVDVGEILPYNRHRPFSCCFVFVIIFLLIKWVALAPKMWLPKLILHPHRR